MPDSMPGHDRNLVKFKRSGAAKSGSIYYPRCSALRQDSCSQLRAFPGMKADDLAPPGRSTDKPR